MVRKMKLTKDLYNNGSDFCNCPTKTLDIRN